MKTILLFISLLSLTLIHSQRLPLSDLEVNDNVYTLNGTPYTGNIYELYDSGQLKSEYEVKDGKLNGYEKLFWVNSTYNENKYLDSLKIKEYTQNLNEVKSKYDTKFKDSILHKKKSTDLYYNAIGGPKKFFKIQNKDASGKLEGDKKEVYDNYLFSINKIDEYEIELPVLRSNISTLTKNLNDEKNKPSYKNILKTYTTLISGVKDGLYQLFNEQGELLNEGYYKSNKRNGEWKDYDVYGNLLTVTTYLSDNMDGSFKKYNGDHVILEGNYQNNIKEGEWKDFDNYGRLIATSTYDNDTLNGTYKKYFQDVVVQEGVYQNDFKEGVWKEFDNSGNIISEFIYLKDTLNGVYKKYNGNVVVEEGQYTNGLMNGEWVFRYDNGKKKGEVKFVNGDGTNVDNETNIPYSGRDGFHQEWYANGNLKLTETYVNGKVHGEMKGYYDNGQLKYHNKKVKRGEILLDYSISYYENGKMKMQTKINPIKGVDKIKYQYNEDGSVQEKLQYKNGKWVQYKTQKEIDEENRKYEEKQNRIISCWMCSREFKYKNGYGKPFYDKYNIYNNCGCHYTFAWSLFSEPDYCSMRCACEAIGGGSECLKAKNPKHY